MRLQDFTLYHLRRALCLYLDQAFPGGGVCAVPRPQLPEFVGPDSAPLADSLKLFKDESAQVGRGSRCYALRLGNSRYPFMKLRFQEVLVRDEFFFSVDTHDQMFEGKDDPELAQLMAYNRALKCSIEACWEGAGLQTTASIKGMIEGMPVEREPRKGLRVLLVDDDLAIQDTVALLLKVKGYDVDRACDGQEAVEMADPNRHALVLMDVEMPRMTGLEASQQLKSDPRTASIPILLATAGAVELARGASPDGFLVKPFQAEALFRFLDSLIGPARARSVTT